MDNDNSRYLDFSDDDWLQSTFDPDGVDDWVLKLYGRHIQKHLALRNPLSSLRGLLSFQIVTIVSHMSRIEKTLDRILLTLIAIAVAFGWYAFF